jgi:methionyl-tRNA synthetase
MSKTLGNFVSRDVILDLCAEYSRDAFRYFVLREVPFGNDGDFSAAAVKLRYNNELANGVGNLLSRTVNMIGRYFDGKVPAPQAPGLSGLEAELLAGPLKKHAEQGPVEIEHCQFQEYIGLALALAGATDQYIETTSPFKLAKDPANQARLGTILYTCAEAVRIVLTHLEPFMPEKAAEGLAAIGQRLDDSQTLAQRTQWGLLTPGTPVVKIAPLFMRKP